MLELRLGSESVMLHADGAVHWARRSTLVIADPHFGKDDLFRRAGVAIPRGPTLSDLERLTALLRSTGAGRLVVLGDFLHGASESGDDLWRAFRAWRQSHAELQVVLVAGNHDRHEDWSGWRGLVELHHDALAEAPFVFRHDPEADARGFVLAGHLHPVFSHPALGPRAPRVFWRQSRVLVLPAWGAFTGGARIDPAPRDGVFACTPEGVLPLQGGSLD